MISAWDIYWVLQLDSISTMLCVLASFSVVALFAVSGLFLEDGVRTKTLGITATVSAILIVIATLVPDTKTAAAMIIVPKIANNEAIREEASDLYGLAKRALVEAVASDEPERE